jgi:hypothetical protein
MLFAASGLIGRSVAATDGRIGHVGDFLVDRAWTVRWMVVDTGEWLPGRKVLIHPSAVGALHLPERPAIPMFSMTAASLTVPVNLRRNEIAASPEAAADAPVTEALEDSLFDHYGWDPMWSAPGLGGEPAILRPAARAVPAEGPAEDAADGAPRLGSAAALRGFSIRAADGPAGSLEIAVIDSARWTVRFLVVATRGWLTGKLVRIPASSAVAAWSAREAMLELTRREVEAAPVWDPLAVVEEIEKRFGGGGR